MHMSLRWLPLISLCAGSVFAYGESWETDRHWDILTEYVYMRRSHMSNRDLATDTNQLSCSGGCPTDVVLDAQDMINKVHFISGFRVGLSYMPDLKSVYETKLLYLWPWEAKKTVTSPTATLSFPFHNSSFTNDFNNANVVHAKYRSHFLTFELNYLRHFNRVKEDYFAITGIFGIRYLFLGESAHLNYINAADESSYDSKTRNDMIGIQAGFDFQMNPLRHWSLDFTGKGGLGLNRAHESIFLGDDNNTTVVRDFKKENWQDTVFAEGAGQISYQILPCMNMHVGYQILFVSGMAIALDEFSYSTDPSDERFITRNYAIVHGGFIGFNFDF